MWENHFKKWPICPEWKVGCVCPMVIVSMLPRAELGPNDHRKTHLTLWALSSHGMKRSKFARITLVMTVKKVCPVGVGTKFKLFAVAKVWHWSLIKLKILLIFLVVPVQVFWCSKCIFTLYQVNLWIILRWDANGENGNWCCWWSCKF